MKSTGIVRKIDELGRIVIPKEVRRRLKINNGDPVDISLADDCVIITKYYSKDSANQHLKDFCLAIKDVYNCDIIITDLEKLLYNTIDENYNSQDLNEEFLKRVNSYLDIELSKLNKVILTVDYTLDKDAIIYKIEKDGQLYGYLMILDVMISKKNRDLAGLILNYLNRSL